MEELEDMVHKELLKVLICNVDAKLLKAGEEQDESPWCRMAASSLLMSQCSESENMRIFIAERMWA
ncbi:hypothetical protein EK904_009082 [Melospiza melodia maxima]|nr:hypothetical protein EK904_009082 [Melospiza melodia maxima]